MRLIARDCDGLFSSHVPEPGPLALDPRKFSFFDSLKPIVFEIIGVSKEANICRDAKSILWFSTESVYGHIERNCV